MEHRKTHNKQANEYIKLTFKIAGRAMRKIRQGSVIECQECRVGVAVGALRKTARKWPCGDWKQKNEPWEGLGRRHLKEGSGKCEATEVGASVVCMRLSATRPCAQSWVSKGSQVGKSRMMGRERGEWSWRCMLSLFSPVSEEAWHTVLL